LNRRILWTLVFLPITALAIGGELWAGLDSNPDTIPWTDYITHYVPWPVTALAITILVAWVPWHFWRHYRDKRKERS
jgi:hypothetical protein